MKTSTLICGAGITGISAAFHLARAGKRDILLVDERPPLSLTSDRSTECYRNWWPQPDMLALMNRSIDLMEGLAHEDGNTFHMNRRGYLYVTANPDKIPAFHDRAERTSRLGAGQLRVHTESDFSYLPAKAEGWESKPEGADLLLGNKLIRRHFPYLTESAVAALHARRAGWLSAQQLGMTLLEGARRLGVRFELARVDRVEVREGRVSAVRFADGRRVECPVFINAAGPHLREVGKMLGMDLPVHTELHLKMAIKDPLGVVGRDAPLLIWDDEQRLPWNEEERCRADRRSVHPLAGGDLSPRRAHAPRGRAWKRNAGDAVGISDPPFAADRTTHARQGLSRSHPPRDGGHVAALARVLRKNATSAHGWRLLHKDDG